MTTYLDQIILDHRRMAENDNRKTVELKRVAKDLLPCKGFREALKVDGVSVIAEIKRKSPSKGLLNENLDPVLLAKSYESNGASCISVLTDEKYFSGNLEDLVNVRKAVDIPILRKDFTVSPNDVLDARINGADAVLLIVAALEKNELVDLHGLAVELGLDVLVEIHDESELAQAIYMNADLIGVNQRDLFSFKVDTSVALRLARGIPSTVVKVCESGIVSDRQMEDLRMAGYQAALIGELLVKSNSPELTLQSLLAAGGKLNRCL